MILGSSDRVCFAGVRRPWPVRVEALFYRPDDPACWHFRRRIFEDPTLAKRLFGRPRGARRFKTHEPARKLADLLLPMEAIMKKGNGGGSNE